MGEYDPEERNSAGGAEKWSKNAASSGLLPDPT